MCYYIVKGHKKNQAAIRLVSRQVSGHFEVVKSKELEFEFEIKVKAHGQLMIFRIKKSDIAAESKVRS
jgi:hypothetical protein